MTCVWITNSFDNLYTFKFLLVTFLFSKAANERYYPNMCSILPGRGEGHFPRRMIAAHVEFDVFPGKRQRTQRNKASPSRYFFCLAIQPVLRSKISKEDHRSMIEPIITCFFSV